jgi:DNA modification methylase
LENSFDRHQYAEKDLVFIKLPLKLPYYADSKEFERVNGSVKIGNIEYKYVKRRVYHDTVELACLPNVEKQKFELVKNDLLKISGDWQNSHPGKKATKDFQNLNFDYCNKIISYSITNLGEFKKEYGLSPVYFLPENFDSAPEHPPKSA